MKQLILLVVCGSILVTYAHAVDEHTPPVQTPSNETSQNPSSNLGLPDNLDAWSSRSQLWNQLVQTAAMAAELQQELAASRAANAVLQRELGELRQFILDHEEFGEDFEEYDRIRAIAELEEKRRAARERRTKLDSERAQRKLLLEQRNTKEEQERLQKMKSEHYARAGFSSIGSDVYLGRSAYFYAPRDETESPITYTPGSGVSNINGASEIDYANMTISGSVLNASTANRNIGVAITFFDEYGNQVGAEIIQIDNARPNIPYPFTSKLQMALNRPFASSSSYVLFADANP
ncbi:MAG: hypothetical protein P8L37_06895 [Phycisphaerales bacterium]|nr:hypothetical protein [Phycisphaerales bacterium]